MTNQTIHEYYIQEEARKKLEISKLVKISQQETINDQHSEEGKPHPYISRYIPKRNDLKL